MENNVDAARRPIGPFPNTDIIVGPEPEKQVKKFEAARDNAFREDFVPNGGPQNRGPIEGGATGPSPTPRPHKATGADGVAGILKFEWDIGGNGKLQIKKPEVAVTPHFEWTPGRGLGAGLKDGKPGVAEGNADGGDVYTLGDAQKKAGASSSASPGKSNAPEGLDWTDDKHRIKDSVKELKRNIPSAPARPDYNDLGPSTNEPEQKPQDAAVARNDDARFGGDLAQRI